MTSFRLIVKANDKAQAVEACKAHDCKCFVARVASGDHILCVVHSTWESVANWFCETNSAPYPNGALLLYTYIP